MDQERYVQEGKEERLQEIYDYWQLKHKTKGVPVPNMQNVNYRLIQEFEVPEWIRQNTKPEDPDKFLQEFGAGKRQRKTVNYNEEFSEGQWLKIIEEGGDPQAEAEKIRKRREMGELDVDGQDGLGSKRRKLNEGYDLNRGGDDYGDEDDQGDQEEDDEEEDYHYGTSKARQGAKTGGSSRAANTIKGYQGELIDGEDDGLVHSDAEDQQE